MVWKSHNFIESSGAKILLDICQILWCASEDIPLLGNENHFYQKLIKHIVFVIIRMNAKHNVVKCNVADVILTKTVYKINL